MTQEDADRELVARTGDDYYTLLNMLTYWWDKNQDIENGSWEVLKPYLKKLNPEIYEAWKNFKKSKKVLNNLL